MQFSLTPPAPSNCSLSLTKTEAEFIKRVGWGDAYYKSAVPEGMVMADVYLYLDHTMGQTLEVFLSEQDAEDKKSFLSLPVEKPSGSDSQFCHTLFLIPAEVRELHFLTDVPEWSKTSSITVTYL